jgi:hypothetical protein
MKSTLFILLLCITLLADIGKITFLKGGVTLTNKATSRSAKVGLMLQEGDTIQTQKASVVKIIFKDKTIVSIGSKTHFSIDEYLFDEASNQNHVNFSAQKGIFRMVTGKIGKLAPKKFKLKTKTATMGIRGTIFSVILEEEQEHFVCEKGSIYVEAQGKSETIKAGFSSTVTPGSPPQKATKTPSDILQKIEDATTSWKGKSCEL